MNVFWLGSGSGSGHVTLPIRRLVDASVQLVEKPGYQDSEVCVSSITSKDPPQLTNTGEDPGNNALYIVQWEEMTFGRKSCCGLGTKISTITPNRVSYRGWAQVGALEFSPPRNLEIEYGYYCG